MQVGYVKKDRTSLMMGDTRAALTKAAGRLRRDRWLQEWTCTDEKENNDDTQRRRLPETISEWVAASALVSDLPPEKRTLLGRLAVDFSEEKCSDERSSILCNTVACSKQHQCLHSSNTWKKEMARIVAARAAPATERELRESSPVGCVVSLDAPLFSSMMMMQGSHAEEKSDEAASLPSPSSKRQKINVSEPMSTQGTDDNSTQNQTTLQRAEFCSEQLASADWGDSGSSSAVNAALLREAAELIFDASAAEALRVSRALQLSALPDGSLVRMVDILLDAKRHIGDAQRAALISSSICARVQELKAPASRAILDAAKKVAASSGELCINSFFVPLMMAGTGREPLNKAQSEVVCHVIKLSFPLEALGALLDRFVSGAPAPVAWNALTIPVFQSIVNRRPPLSDGEFAAFARSLELAVETDKNNENGSIASSIKFAGLMLGVISKFPAQTKVHGDAFERILSKCTSGMAKAAKRALAKARK